MRGSEKKCNKRAVLGLSANFLNIVIRKNQKNKFLPERNFPSVKIVLSTENNFELIRIKVKKPHYLAFLRGLRGLEGIKIIPNNL